MKPSVLVADDDAQVLNIITRYLERHGFHVLKACDGATAVAMFEEHVAKISAVILDMMMPDMDGLEAYLEMEKIDADVRVVLATGLGNVDTTDRIGRQLECIGKPYALADLIEKLERVGCSID